MKKAALHSLGCKVNSYETEAMRQLLEEGGYQIVPFDQTADLYIINTCSVTNVADRKSRQMIHRARKLNPDAIVCAAGCYVQTSAEQAAADAAIDIVIGNNKKQDLLELIREFEDKHQKDPEGKEIGLIDINLPGQSYEELKVSAPAEHTRAFLKVQDGCNQFCSYCIIPYARGRVRSRKMEDVMAECRHLAENGYQEIVLTGIHLSSYGVDIDSDLLSLIKAVHEIEGIRRIRLGSLEPGIITEEFVAELVSLPKVCPHFHLSLQSGSDSVLKRMNRKYTSAEYLEKCQILRKHYQHPALTTDIIVGFPGETEEEFMDSCAFAREVAFYEIHVFKYSRRDGTVAAKMPDQVADSIKSDRSNQLMSIAEELKAEYLSWYEGKKVEVLFEESSMINDQNYFHGFTPEYVKCFYKTDKDISNCIKTVEFLGQL